MIPRTLIDRAPMPDGSGELRLIRRGDEFSIMLGANELMNSRLSGSEEQLARIACERLSGRQRPAALIGGLGMGFTLRAALERLPRDAAVTVAELVPAVIAWAKGPLAHIFGDSLADPRVTLAEADVADLIVRSDRAWDAILLDVDNGPDGLSVAANDRLYDAAGLAAAKRALRPGGILGIWSSDGDPRFTRRLERAGFAVEEVRARAARSGRGAHHLLWFATKR
jgi:spermidine synthase